MKILLATRSMHKAGEVARILEECGGPRILTLDDAGLPWSGAEDALEPWETFEENAASKARYFARATGLPTVADDSGLEVDALDGRPGVRTKRFAPPGRFPGLARDEANNAWLLESLRGVPEPERGGRYVCVASFVEAEAAGAGGSRRLDAGPEGDDGAQCFRGEAPGRILERRRGGGGFGYDPLFLDLELGRTFAELAPGEKNARSHRGRAFRAFASFLAGR